MKRFYLMLVVFGFMTAVSAYAADEVKWVTLTEGMERAKAEKKPSIVDFFFGKGCPRCEIMQKEVYDNPKIAAKIMADFIPIRVDLTKELTPEEQALGEKYEYKHDCLLVFLDHEMNVMEDARGKRLCFMNNIEPEWFIEYLDTVKAQYGK